MTRQSGERATQAQRGVLIALRANEGTGSCIARARDLAQRFGETVRVLCVIAEKSRPRRLLSGNATPPSAATDSVQRWLAQELGDLAREAPVDFRRGHFARQVIEETRELRPRYVVLRESPRSGDVVTQIARESGAQVLVAHSKTSPTAILAATDLKDPSFSVLRRAAQLARAMSQPLITFHNVDPLSMMTGRAALSSGVVLSGGVSAATRRESLVGVSRALQVEPTPVIRTELDPVHAILDEAEVCDAGLIVVGTHSCSWWQRLMSESVAVRVVNEADRDVLVTPIGLTV